MSIPSAESLLWQHLQRSRWYAGKGRDAELVAVHPLPWLTPPGPGAVRLVVAEVRNHDGAAQTHHYLLPLSYHGADYRGHPDSAIGSCHDPELGEVVLHDATRHPQGQELLLDTILGGGRRDDDAAALRAEIVDTGELSAGLVPRAFGGEQSNTSIMYGERAMLKVFRRLELGRNLDIEVHRGLAETSAAGELARLYGWLEAEWIDSTGASCRADAAMLVEQLHQVADGWQLAVTAAGSAADFTEPAAALGAALRAVHRGLADAFGSGHRSGAEVAAEMRTRLAAARRDVPELAADHSALEDIMTSLASAELDTQRVHGDFHLGQTLLGAQGWRIIDFEGEPLKSLTERREPDSVWRDVAGMLRSLDYAGGFALRSGALDSQHQVSEWVAAASAAFLTGYTGGRPLTEAEARVVAAYQADKAVYEVVYEARNRPDWLDIPLTALGALAGQHGSDAQHPHPGDAPPEQGGSTMTIDTLGGLSGTELEGFHSGADTEAWRRLGSHLLQLDDGAGGTVRGTRFAVWAPNAREVRVYGDFNGWDGESHPMQLVPGTGVWALFVPEAAAGAVYKYRVHGADGRWVDKADPMARFAQSAPDTASIVFESDYSWGDQEWLQRRAESRPHAEPMSVYEVHLGGWRPGKSYRELAEELVEYVTWQGFTHVEFLPLAQHPFAPSWGYQVTGYFAPMSQFGTPDEFRYLVDRLHQAGIGVIMDWVPGHFPKDEWALGRFDGTALYEHADPRQGEQPDWGTYVFNFGRSEVKSFLVSNALYWITEFHIDGLRVDAVASMLYLDYSRGDDWVPNVHGGRENLEAVDLLRYVNSHLYQRVPGVITIAEESTSWPGVTKPVHHDGLGFGFKWNMGWMNDTLRYLAEEPVHRQYHHNLMTFAMVYSFSENFVLPISHDEVVHGKGSMVNKVPGDDWQKFATLRAYYAFMWSHPGKQLLFMGNEFGQRAEFNESKGLEWWVCDLWGHHGLQLLFRDLNRTYRELPALWKLDNDPAGFRWLNADDTQGNVFSYLRSDGEGRFLAIAVNFSPVPRTGYSLGLPRAGVWREVLNTDAGDYDGTGEWGNLGQVEAREVPAHGLPCSAEVTVPPLAAVWLGWDPRETAELPGDPGMQ